MSIGNRIKTFRKQKGFTQPQLAELAETTANTISRYEKDKIIPTIASLNKIADALEITVDDLVKESNVQESTIAKDIAMLAVIAETSEQHQNIIKKLTILNDQQLKQLELFLDALTD